MDHVEKNLVQIMDVGEKMIEKVDGKIMSRLQPDCRYDILRHESKDMLRPEKLKK